MADPRRIRLIQSPTPLHRLERLSNQLGIDLWIKRDDLTGFALGGNKGRKLEYIMADVLDHGADAVVTSGALQSNFIRQLGAACALFDVRCVAAVMALPFEAAIGKPREPSLGERGGNVLLDELVGVELHRFPDDDWGVLSSHASELVSSLEREGLNVYRVPIGGSSALGGFAFFKAAEELKSQGQEFDFVVTPTSSGSTQAGLGAALRGTSTKLIGIAADPEPDLVGDVINVAQGLAALLGSHQSLRESDFDIRSEWVGPGYGVPSAAGNEAIRLLARAEGIFLDPIYTGKAFTGLLDLARSGQIGGRVLFWHTGGTPALFAHP